MPRTAATCQRLPPRGGKLGLPEPLGPLRQARRLADVGIPDNYWFDHGGLDWGQPHAAGLPWPLRITQRALGCSGPWQQLATAQLGWAPPSHALSKQGALVCSDGRADLSQQLIRRIITPGPLAQLDAPATLAECIDQEHVMDIVAR